MATKFQMVDCPKCDGKGFIQAFGHVANGVCFCCKGAKQFKVTADDIERTMTPEQVRKCEWVMNATVDRFAKLTDSQLVKCREFCHWHFLPYPNLHKAWTEKGEAFFQAYQERRREELYKYAL